MRPSETGIKPEGESWPPAGSYLPAAGRVCTARRCWERLGGEQGVPCRPNAFAEPWCSSGFQDKGSSVSAVSFLFARFSKEKVCFFKFERPAPHSENNRFTFAGRAEISSN